ncbi:hypothetical protein [Ferrovum sp.]
MNDCGVKTSLHFCARSTTLSC